jgi:hypothetical protein
MDLAAKGSGQTRSGPMSRTEEIEGRARADRTLQCQAYRGPFTRMERRSEMSLGLRCWMPGAVAVLREIPTFPQPLSVFVVWRKCGESGQITCQTQSGHITCHQYLNRGTNRRETDEPGKTRDEQLHCELQNRTISACPDELLAKMYGDMDERRRWRSEKP